MRADVVIVTALSEEYDAARDVALASTAPDVGVTEWRSVDADIHFLAGNYRTPDGATFSVALARPTRMGGRSAAPVATKLVDLLRPICLAMSGVCAGNPDELAPGDVVVADLVYEYDEGMLEGGAFDGDHQQYPQDVRWLREAQEFSPESLPSFGSVAGDAIIWFLERLHRGQDPRTHPARKRYFPRGTWKPRLQQLELDGFIRRVGAGWALTGQGSAKIQRVLYDDVDGPDRLPFEVVTGPIASGTTVIRDPEIWGRLKRMGARKIAALELEAATIATVAHGLHVPHWLVAKGVMDHADFGKDDRYKEFAARASAEVLYGLLARLIPAYRIASATTVEFALPYAHEPAPSPLLAGEFPGRVKLEIIRRLSRDWQDLADIVGVPHFVKVRFRRGNEPRELWEWLESRGRLAELLEALGEIGRDDLTRLIQPSLE